MIYYYGKCHTHANMRLQKPSIFILFKRHLKWLFPNTVLDKECELFTIKAGESLLVCIVYTGVKAIHMNDWDVRDITNTQIFHKDVQ